MAVLSARRQRIRLKNGVWHLPKEQPEQLPNTKQGKRDYAIIFGQRPGPKETAVEIRIWIP
jgi:hypothetical protein